jgi:nicotinamide-nucleotide adenylyltransferase
MITLFIGRFQPFHKGHLQDIINALKFSEKVIIAIGSSQEKNTLENPFSFEERKSMIEQTMQLSHITRYEIVGIPDINDDNKWVSHVKSIVKKFDIVYTGNEKVRDLFIDAGFNVKQVAFLPDINATKIRECINKGKKWELLVPKNIAEFVKKANCIERLKKINNS